MSVDSNTPHRAAVITPGRVMYGNGASVPTQPGTGADLRVVLDGTLDRFTADSTIVIDGVTVAQVTSRGLKAAGWNYSTIAPWTLFHRSDGRTVSIGHRASMNPTQHFGVLFGRDTDPGVVALHLDRYHHATGTAWRGTPVTTALAGIRLSWENDRYQPLWSTPKIGPGYGVGPLVWSRDLTEDETEWGWVHTFDANSAYLGAAISGDFAWSRLHQTGPMMFDARTPGYWLIDLEDATRDLLRDPHRPPLLPAKALLKGGSAWMTTPYAKLLEDLGDRCEVRDSVTGRGEERAGGTRLHPAQTRILRKWGERQRDALDTISRGATGVGVIEGAIKRTYKDATGGLQKTGMRISRADWGHTLIDQWRSTMYRTILRVHDEEGVWPVAVRTDSLSYADCSDRPDVLAKAIGVRSGLGGYKHEATTTAAHWAAAHVRKTR